MKYNLLSENGDEKQETIRLSSIKDKKRKYFKKFFSPIYKQCLR